MEILVVVLMASLFSAIISFLRSIYYNIKNDIEGVRFMARGLLSLSVSCAIIFYDNKGNSSFGRDSGLAIATLVFVVLSVLFYLSYQFNKNRVDDKKD